MQQFNIMTKEQLIEELKEAKRLLSEQEENFQNCVDNMLGRLALFSAVRDEKGIIIDFICEFANKTTCQAMGNTLEELVGKRMLKVWSGTKGELFNRYKYVCETGEAYFNNNVHYCDQVNVNVSYIYEMKVFKVGDGIGISVRNVTEKRKYKAELRKREKKFETLFYNNIAAMAVVKSADWTYIDVNPAWEQMMGYSREEAIGQNTLSLGLVDSRTVTFQEKYCKLSEKGFVVGEQDYVTKAGETRQALCSIVALESDEEKLYLSTLIDITDQCLVEAELSRLDRLNIVGEMAAGIGHEIRNPMTTVRGYLQLFQRKKTFSQYCGQLETMIEELDRANLIITEFLSLAKNKTIDMKPSNINNIIQTLFPLLQAEAFRLGHEIELQLKEVPDIRIDERAFRQMLHNLVRNGLEAMEHSGKVTIKTCWDGEKAVLSIRDMGTGIAAHVMDRLGIPFVTTKDKGTGLGLSVCYRIAQRHNAKIKVKTSEEGTEFIISFEKMEIIPISLW